ncbi:hypothetical protein [Nesterenkonia ebinurensis]|uniref:hypothetical protein n=1 Tax=Nesterenkonia ebinurensis TaxID=2608252 RepID=UPI00123DB04A|nr:hypothetical protein [Nesterenkonia ebinurensis]
MSEFNTTGETVEELSAGDSGSWLVTTAGSQHIWDLDAWEYTRFPSEESKSGAMPFDGQPLKINRVQWLPKVGERPWVWFDDPEDPVFFEHFRLNSVVSSIERLANDEPEEVGDETL